MAKEKKNKRIEEKDDEIFSNIIGPPKFSRKKGLLSVNRPQDRYIDFLARNF